jgi:hypothetical protein
MAKVDEWRKRRDEWSKILKEPKNLGLRAGGTGVSETILKVGDAEMDYAKGKEPGGKFMETWNDLHQALSNLVDLCKSTSDKHKKLFTTACKYLDTVKDEATKRRTELAKELDEVRHAVADKCEASLTKLKGAKEMDEFAEAWHAFAQEFESHGHQFPALQPYIAKLKQQKPPAGDLSVVKGEYVKLAQSCQTATGIR